VNIQGVAPLAPNQKWILMSMTASLLQRSKPKGQFRGYSIKESRFSESRFVFTWQIKYNSDIIWCHFVCLCCFRSYFAHFHYSLARCCSIAAVVAIDVFLKSFEHSSPTSRRKCNGIQAWFSKSEFINRMQFFTESRFRFTIYLNPDYLIKYPLNHINESLLMPITISAHGLCQQIRKLCAAGSHSTDCAHNIKRCLWDCFTKASLFTIQCKTMLRKTA